MEPTPWPSAERSLATVNTNYTVDMIRNMTGTVTMPPIYDEYLANHTITQETYDEIKEEYRKANESVAQALENAEANKDFMDAYYAKLNQTINGSGPGLGSTTPGTGTNGGGASSSSSSSSSGLNTASMIGIALGAIATVVLIVGVYLFHKRTPAQRRRRREMKNKDKNKNVNDDDNNEELQAEYDPTTLGSTVYTGMDRSTKQSTAGSSNSTNKSNYKTGDFAMLWEDEALLAVRVPFDKILKGPKLTRGGYGQVYRGEFRGQQIAIKSLLPEKRKDVAMIKMFLAEIKFMATLEHPRIVTFVGVAWESLSDLCVLTEFMDGGDLFSVLSGFANDEPSRKTGFDPEKVKIALHVAHALTYLHSLQPMVLHRDLKSRNILLDTQYNAKLTDFGISREHIDQTMTAGVGSSLWMAPEVMLGGKYNEKADVFSFGVVLSELDTHQLPYSDAMEEEGSGRQIPQTAILQLVSMGRLSISLTANCQFETPEMYELARQCVAMDPQERPTAAQVLHRVHLVSRQMDNAFGGGGMV